MLALLIALAFATAPPPAKAAGACPATGGTFQLANITLNGVGPPKTPGDSPTGGQFDFSQSGNSGLLTLLR